ncbi:hypothetical protein JHL21_13195 [Devosia sp. WQ 349]|nr:hypothetical protein [Devosia sp. WQ 349K1]MBK1795453.1 hypothetical protein [Devosia sp. WQ 349K1]
MTINTSFGRSFVLAIVGACPQNHSLLCWAIALIQSTAHHSERFHVR